ncbi:hypothetical protein [Desulfonatronum sp. SC1]|uniref:hypothetical protein n=1 Tax=Desulfonatronum sp. SC1 TaxID=2109626 RepID=UPI000D2FC73C|nr:hypothetical protein [Desulfonatronum sp. SC1]PTN32753.1 hypothetical protein C6366_16015 [Desulfonatronum sp. SC1]
MRWSPFFIAAVALCVTGCAASPDPRTGGFFGGIQGLASGSYEQRVQEREQSLERLRALQQEMQTEEAELQATKQSLEEIILWEREAVQELETNSEVLLAELAELESLDASSEAQVAQLKQRIADLQRNTRQQQSALDALEGDGSGETDPDLRLQQLVKQREALRKEYDLLLELSLELAR